MAILATWLTLAVYMAGVAMILVAFAYRYRPTPWLQLAAQGTVLAAVALATGAAVIAWQGKIPSPAPAAASHPPAGTARLDHAPNSTR